MNRRQMLCLAAGIAALGTSILARAQSGVRRIAYLGGGPAEGNAMLLAAFRDGMAKLSWVEQRHYAIDTRYARTLGREMDGAAAELILTRPEVLLTAGNETLRTLARATSTIPIVFGLANGAALARPGVPLPPFARNATGVMNLAEKLPSRRLRALREAFPRASNIGVLFVRDGSLNLRHPEVAELDEAAASLSCVITPLEIRQAGDIDPALKRGAALGVGAWLVIEAPLLAVHSRDLVARMARYKLPAVYPDTAFVEAGGLMSYAPSYRECLRRSAGYVDRILRGEKPERLPVEQASVIEIALNLKTAMAQGIVVPPALLLQAERVIE